MFSGIVETVGHIEKIEHEAGCMKMIIATQNVFDDLAIGDSVAVNGVCLTVTDFTKTTFNVTAVPETLRLTNLGELILGSEVNLERAVKASSRIGGHNIQGHVDGTGKIIDLHTDGGESALLLKISATEEVTKYIVAKGYVALDGMSITVIEVQPEWFSITVIPHTQEVTIAKNYSVGKSINIEVDILGKYIEKFVKLYS